MINPATQSRVSVKSGQVQVTLVLNSGQHRQLSQPESMKWARHMRGECVVDLSENQFEIGVDGKLPQDQF